VLRGRNLVVEYPVGRGRKVHAVSDVSFDVLQGETLSVVGESGCGKSSLARAIVHLPPPTSGTIEYGDRVLTGLMPRQLRRVRVSCRSSSGPELVAQPAPACPRHRLGAQQGVGFGSPPSRGAEITRAVDELPESVGIDPASNGDSKPGQLSGGQCQRVSIARALMLEPKILICGEPVSAPMSLYRLRSSTCSKT
jgi:peptide/nickel transport system ATP-binding protein